MKFLSYVSACLFLWVGIFAHAAADVAIRSRQAPCEYYLVAKENTTMGKPVTSSLAISDLQAWLATNPAIDAETQALYVVGAPMGHSDRATLVNNVRSALADHGLAGVDVKTIRRLQNFIAEQTGLFSIAADGSYERLADLNEIGIRAAIASVAPEKLESLALIGLPVFGSAKKNFENLVQLAVAARNAPPPELKVEARPLTLLNEFLRRPTEALKHLAQQMRYFFPMAEDWQKPTVEELGSMGQKLVIPGILTFSVMYLNNTPLQILIPVTIVNALNSGLSGTIRTFIGNWFARSANKFPDMFMRQFLYSGFFTTTLYWAGVGSVAALKNILNFASWMNFFQTKWLSNLFQTSWRLPIQGAIYGWERLRSAEGVSSKEMRYKGSVFEKYLSYVMTQFYILSIVTHSSLMKVVAGGDSHFYLGNHALQPGESLLMEFNIGHVAMAGAGIASALLLRNSQVMDLVGNFIAKLDGWESRFHQLYLKPVKATVNWVRDTFFRRSVPDSVEASPRKGTEKE